MTVEGLRTFLFWCTVINYGVLLLWVVLFKTARNMHYRFTAWWFPVSAERYDTLMLGGVAAYKLAIIMFNLVPYIALRLMT